MNILQYFWHPGSRKVAFGLLLFVMSCVWFWQRLIAVDDLMTCVFLSTALIGGGTVVDSFLAAKKKNMPEPPKPEEKKPE